MKLLIAALCLAVAAPALATDKHIPERNPPPPVIVVQHDHDNNAAAGLLLGAGITYWIVCHRDNYHPGPKTHKACPKKR